MKIPLNKPAQVMIISSALFVLLRFIILQSFDFWSTFIYIAIAGILGIIFQNDMSNKKIFILAVVGSVAYNGGAVMLQQFTISILPMVITAAEQGILTVIVWKIMGGTK
jgi:hypothetical protein